MEYNAIDDVALKSCSELSTGDYNFQLREITDKKTLLMLYQMQFLILKTVLVFLYFSESSYKLFYLKYVKNFCDVNL